MGIAVGPGELLTPVTAARRVLGQSAGARALLLVSREVSAELGEACATVPPPIPSPARGRAPTPARPIPEAREFVGRTIATFKSPAHDRGPHHKEV